MAASDYGSLDQSLGALRAFGPDLKNGLSNHVPMVAEALCALGESDASRTWVSAHLSTIADRPPAPFQLNPANWQGDLGKPPLFSDWQRYFETEISALGWQGALDRWAGRLAPGLFASATHGIIRTGHAARALAAGDTDLRKAELADGLALWAATYQALPTRWDTPLRYGSVAEAFSHLPLVPREKQKTDGLITEALAPLNDLEVFAGIIAWLDVSGSPSSIAEDLARQQARHFLANVKSPLLAIVFTHAVTSVHAIVNLAPHVAPATLRSLLTYGWQAGAALYAAYADETTPADQAPPPEMAAEIVAAAVANGDDHVIKLSEACLAFHAQTGDQVFLSVPARARAYLPWS